MSASPRMIRYFCQVLPSPAGDLAFAYMAALDAGNGRRLRACPIGAADLACDRRWWAAAALFDVPLATSFVNVVCAPLGLAVATTPLPAAIRRQLGADAPRSQTALEALWTVGVVNIAILASSGPGTTEEIVGLHRYDRVIVPREEDVRPRLADGLSPERVVHVPPERERLMSLLAALGV